MTFLRLYNQFMGKRQIIAFIKPSAEALPDPKRTGSSKGHKQSR